MESGDSPMIRAWLKRWSLWIALVVVAVLFGGRGQLESEKLADTVDDVAVLSKENRHLVNSLQAAIVESCAQNGNASRRVARETLQEEIHDAKHTDPEVIAAFNLPPAKIEELIAQNVGKLKKRLGRVHAVNCAAQYHISPGSGERRRDNADSSAP